MAAWSLDRACFQDDTLQILRRLSSSKTELSIPGASPSSLRERETLSNSHSFGPNHWKAFLVRNVATSYQWIKERSYSCQAGLQVTLKKEQTTFRTSTSVALRKFTIQLWGRQIPTHKWYTTVACLWLRSRKARNHNRKFNNKSSLAYFSPFVFYLPSATLRGKKHQRIDEDSAGHWFIGSHVDF